MCGYIYIDTCVCMHIYIYTYTNIPIHTCINRYRCIDTDIAITLKRRLICNAGSGRPWDERESVRGGEFSRPSSRDHPGELVEQKLRTGLSTGLEFQPRSCNLIATMTLP